MFIIVVEKSILNVNIILESHGGSWVYEWRDSWCLQSGKKLLQTNIFVGQYFSTNWESLFSKVGAVLKLGNLTFVPTTNMDGTEGCVISNDYGKIHFYRSNYSILSLNIHVCLKKSGDEFKWRQSHYSSICPSLTLNIKNKML